MFELILIRVTYDEHKDEQADHAHDHDLDLVKGGGRRGRDNSCVHGHNRCSHNVPGQAVM